MRLLVRPIGAVGTAGLQLCMSPHRPVGSLDVFNIRRSVHPKWGVHSFRCSSTLPWATSQCCCRRTAHQLGGRVSQAVSAGFHSSAEAECSSSATPYITATLASNKFAYSMNMMTSFSRCLSTATASSSRVWVARLPERLPVWRSLMGWGQRDRGGPLVEVLLPGHTGPVNLAVGGSEVLAILEGKLFVAPLSVPGPQRNDLAGLSLHEIIPEPVEASSVSVNDFTRHCRRSEELGIPLALGDEGAPRPAMHADTDSHSRFVKVAAGKQHFAALTSHGVLYTWGRGGSWGAGSPLGHGDAKHRCRPTLVGQFINSGEFVVDVACGAANTCVVTSSGRVFSSGAADFGVNGSGMLVSSQLFKELEFFQGVLSPRLVEAKRHIEEEQLRQLEELRKEMEEGGTKRSHLHLRPFEASQGASKNADCGNTDAGSRFPSAVVSDRLRLPKVMASGGESNYPVLAEFFAHADLPLDSCVLGPCHSVALAKNGAVYEWGGPNAKPPQSVDMHWQYPESIFKSPVRKVVAGGFSSSTGFSAALTEKGEAYFWGPGALKMSLGLKATKGQNPDEPMFLLGFEESGNHHNGEKRLVADIFAGQQGCLLVTTGSPESLV